MTRKGIELSTTAEQNNDAKINKVMIKIKSLLSSIQQIFMHENVVRFVKTFKGKIFIACMLVILGIIFIVCLWPPRDAPVKHVSHVETAFTANDTDAQKEVNTIHKEMNSITKEVALINDQIQSQLQQLTQQMQAIEKTIDQLSDKHDLQEVASNLSDSNLKLTQKVNDMQNNIAQVKQSIQPHRYIDPKNLPFKIISVDIWGGEPYATIEMNGKDDLLGVKESKAGWTVAAMDFETRMIEFKNSADQFIKISLGN